MIQLIEHELLYLLPCAASLGVYEEWTEFPKAGGKPG